MLCPIQRHNFMRRILSEGGKWIKPDRGSMYTMDDIIKHMQSMTMTHKAFFEN
jgi:hypothetical protein